MALKSMTGFANCTGSLEDYGWRWEIRSVNGRGLDVRFRLGKREALEPLLRKKISEKFQRGSFQLSLAVEQESENTEILINESALDQVVQAAQELARKIETSPPQAEGLLALPGVMKENRKQETEQQAQARNAALMDSFDTLLDELMEMRAKEGAQIEAMIKSQIIEIQQLSNRAREHPSLSPEAISEKLSNQISQLLDITQAELSKERIYAEAALIAMKADVREELDRIDAHAISVLELCEEAGPVGRKLEFLVQELAREANTLCAKSADPSLTQTGLTLKTVIDQMREQILNLE